MLVLERVEIGTNYTHQRKAAVLGGTQKASHLFSTATKDSPLQRFRHFKHPMNSYYHSHHRRVSLGKLQPAFDQRHNMNRPSVLDYLSFEPTASPGDSNMLETNRRGHQPRLQGVHYD